MSEIIAIQPVWAAALLTACAAPTPVDIAARPAPPSPAVQWSDDALSTCSPETLSGARGRALQVAVTSHLGGCGLRAAMNGAASPAPPMSGAPWPSLQHISDRESLSEAVVCPPSRAANVDLTRFTYVVLYEAMSSAEHHQVPVALVDDEDVAHVAIRRDHLCQGIAPTYGLVGTVLTVPGHNRRVVLHRCPAVQRVCGLVP